MRFVFRLSLSSLAVLGGLGVGLRTIEWPDAAFWSRNRHLAIVSVILVSLVAAIGVYEAARAHRREQTESLELQLQQPLRALFVRLLDELGSEYYRDLGVHAFLLRRRWVWAIPPYRQELIDVATFQLTIRAKVSIRWTQGKGLIGVCWRKNQDVGADLDAEWTDLRDLEPDEWDDLDPDERYGLSHTEYEATHHYGAIVATPIQSHAGAFRGCISADSTAVPYDALWNQRETLQDAAQVVAQLAGLS